MADGVGIKVEGLNELVRTMKRAGVDITELKDANQQAGEIVAAYAQATAPRRSGRLAASVRSTKQVRRARIQAGRAAVPYAGPIHWGWPAHHIAAQPFIADAATATQPTWLAAYQDAIETALSHVRGA
jgi:Bacteriophage HK97-gp10, putative tail-component